MTLDRCQRVVRELMIFFLCALNQHWRQRIPCWTACIVPKSGVG